MVRVSNVTHAFSLNSNQNTCAHLTSDCESTIPQKSTSLDIINNLSILLNFYAFDLKCFDCHNRIPQ